ncbi:type II CRISPR-associated endonuclease Cas1 [Hyphomonas pacifica]|nr:type II CRISPR-associated endonuclease Cas1 [Hyphomonas pacifica]
MPGQIVEISSNGIHLSVERGFLKLSREGEKLGEVPFDNIDAVVVHGHGSTFSANVCARLSNQGAPLIVCGNNHSPVSVVWPIQGHHAQGYRLQAQANASLPLKKRLWKDIVTAKISAQAAALNHIGNPLPGLRLMARSVKSGDSENMEAQAARRYWKHLFGKGFRRDRQANNQNALLNYGYTVLRAGTARAILAAGLHPSLSIMHESRGEALRLADDLMEPFRPWVDVLVHDLIEKGESELTLENKNALADVLRLDMQGPRGASPLQVCIDRMASSLARVYLKEQSALEFPGPPFALARPVP